MFPVSSRLCFSGGGGVLHFSHICPIAPIITNKARITAAVPAMMKSADRPENPNNSTKAVKITKMMTGTRIIIICPFKQKSDCWSILAEYQPNLTKNFACLYIGS